MVDDFSKRKLAYLRSLQQTQQYHTLRAEIEKIRHKSYSVQILFAIAEFHLGHFESAQKIFEMTSTKVSDFDVDTNVDWSALLILMGKAASACAILDDAITLSPRHSLAYARRALCHYILKQNDFAERDINISLTLDPDLVGAWILMAKIKMASQSPDQVIQSQDAINSARAIVKDMKDDGFKKYSHQLDHLQMDLWVSTDQLSEAEGWVQELKDPEEAVFWYCAFADALAKRDLHSNADELLDRVLLNIKPQRAISSKELPLIIARAELAFDQARMQQAFRYFKYAISFDDNNLYLRIKLIDCLLKLNNKQAHSEALKACQIFNDLNEQDFYSEQEVQILRRKTRFVLAKAEGLLENYDASYAEFDALLKDDPFDVDVLQAYGALELERGNIENAISLFQRLAEVSPVIGFKALIQVNEWPKNDSILAHMELEANNSTLSPSVRSATLFQLASAYEKCKNFDKAFDCANRANALSKRTISYDPKENRQYCARIRSVFSREFFERRQKYGHPSSVPVFVLGMPRSGTTLVEQILGCHSEIFGAGELNVITNKITGLNRWERHIGSGRQYPECADDLDANFIKLSADNLLKEFYDLAADTKPNARHVIDKLPHNFLNIGLIKLFFPNAKIISVRRDPRDIAISNYFTNYAAKHSGLGFAYDLSWIGEQLADHNLLMHHWGQVFPGEILEVQYEDLIQDTEGMARKMLSYIGVDWDPQVLRFNKLDRPVKTASVWQVRQPIYKTSAAKWKRYEKHLNPLIEGTNKKIIFDPIDKNTLPEPGLLNFGVELYKNGDFDKAELAFKKLVHHLPNHAAANAMIGNIYIRKGHVQEGISLREKALNICPWNRTWRRDLAELNDLAGNSQKADDIRANRWPVSHHKDGPMGNIDGSSKHNTAAQFLSYVEEDELDKSYSR